MCIILNRLVLLFIIVPLVELVLLLKLAEWTRWEIAVGLVIITGLAGGTLARHQGLSVWRRIQAELGAGRLPGMALLEGAFVLAGGLLLVTPGIITDAVGLLCLLPWTRALLARWLRRRLEKQVTARHFGGSDEDRPDDWVAG